MIGFDLWEKVMVDLESKDVPGTLLPAGSTMLMVGNPGGTKLLVPGKVSLLRADPKVGFIPPKLPTELEEGTVDVGGFCPLGLIDRGDGSKDGQLILITEKFQPD